MGCSHLSLTDLQQLYKYIYRSCIHCPCMESLEASVIVYSALTSLLDILYQIQSLWFIYFDGVCDIASIISSKMICTDFYQNLLHLSLPVPTKWRPTLSENEAFPTAWSNRRPVTTVLPTRSRRSMGLALEEIWPLSS